MSTLRYIVRHCATRLDQWAHFHRFDWRWACDLFDLSCGVPWAVVRFARQERRPAHSVARSFSHHPSRQAEEVLDG